LRMLATSGGKTIAFDYAAFFSNRTGRNFFLKINCEFFDSLLVIGSHQPLSSIKLPE
jgi:hypothetical protein